MKGKKIISLLAGIACIASAMPVHASGYLETTSDDVESSVVLLYDDTRNGTLSINYQDSETSSVEGAVFSYYKVAELKSEVGEPEAQPGSVGSRYHSLFEGITIDGDTKAEDIQEAILELYKDQKVPRAITNAAGIATTELGTGAYLAVETRPMMGHLPSASFVFSVPESFAKDGYTTGWNYKVKADPKSYPINIGTVLTDGETGIHETGFREGAVFKDVVNYHGLIPGWTYIMRGSLIDKETGVPFGISTEQEFVPDKPDGKITLEFTQDTSSLVGHKVVAYEDLFIKKISHDTTDINEGEVIDYDGTTRSDDLENNPTNKVSDGTTINPERIRVATHSDLNDEEQTVHVMRILTSLNGDTGKFVEAGQATITDTVLCEGLIPGNTYILEAELMNKDAEEGAAATGITSEVTFTADAETMCVNVPFTSDFADFAGKRLVAFERIYRYIPEGEGKEEPTPGSESTPSGEQTPQEPSETPGGTTPETPEGTTPETPEETTPTGRILITKHEDINDDEQTVNVLKIRTTLKDKGKGLHETDAGKNTLVDTVEYTGLIPDREYVLHATLVMKDTGKPIEIDGAETEQAFTPDAPDGSVEVEFNIDASKLGGKDAVAFEELWLSTNDAKRGETDVVDERFEGRPEVSSTDEMTKIAEHKDVNDASQTVRVVKISTTLADGSGKKDVDPGKVKLVDAVDCKGLTPGHHYILHAELMEQSGGKSTGLTTDKEFVAKSADEVQNVEFSVDVSQYAGKKLVAFETLYLDADYYSEDTGEEDIPDSVDDENRIKITEHKDINDTAQTINVKPNENPGIKNVKTGDNSPLYLFLLLASAAAVVLVLSSLKAKKVRN